jgi:hypothetical protein
MSDKGEARIHRQFDRIQRKVPFVARLLDWLRRPATRLVRIPIGILLLFGGIFSFLPVLGIWMLPLGLMLLALDVAILRTPLTAVIVRSSRKWTSWQRARR